MNYDVDLAVKTKVDITQRILIGIMLSAFLSAAAALVIFIKSAVTTKIPPPRVADSSILKSPPTQNISTTEFLIKFKAGVTESAKKKILDTAAATKVTVPVDSKGVVIGQLTVLADNIGRTAAATKEVAGNKIVGKQQIFAKALTTDQFLKKYPDKATQVSKSGLNTKVDDLRQWEKVTLSLPTNVPEVIKIIQSDPLVEKIEPNYKYRLLDIPDDYYYTTDLHQPPVYSFGNDQPGSTYPDQYGPKKIHASEAWDVEQGENSILIAVVDTGVDWHHADLQNQIWVNPGEDLNYNGIIDETDINGIDDDQNGFIDDLRGWDFGENGLTGDNNPTDSFGHGTHIAGIIAAQTNNAQGVAGLCRGCKIMPVKIDGEEGMTGDVIAAAMMYAADNGADVINASWGGPRMDVIDEAVNYAARRGVVQVFAAGNEGSDAQYVSPRTEDMIVVAASDYNDQITPWSNNGAWVDVAAPGLNILSTRAAGFDMYGDGLHIVNTNYYYASGTSFSTPQVAGLAGLILSQHPEFTTEEVRQVLRSSSQDVAVAGWDKNAGYGRIDAQAALAIEHPCVAKIINPGNYQSLGQADSPVTDITGTANCQDFDHYKLDYGTGFSPGSWTNIIDSTTSVTDGNLQANFNISTLAPEHYTFRLRVWDQSGAVYEDRHYAIKGYPYLSGFPLATDINLGNSALMSDINNDQRDEILLGNSVIKSGGITLPNWPINNLTSQFSSADLFSEYAGSELVEISTTGDNSTVAIVHLYKNNGEEIITGRWPVTIQIHEVLGGMPVIADVNNDGNAEIVVSDRVLDKQGNTMPGWPVSAGTYVTTGNMNTTPEMEILIDNRLYNYNGTLIGTLPFDSRLRLGQAAVADINFDGKDEFVIARRNSFTYDSLGQLVAYKGDLTIVPGWPQNIDFHDNSTPTYWLPTASPSVGDLNNDGLLEIAFTVGAKAYLFNSNGTTVTGWPQQISGGYFFTNPLLTDIDSDAIKEIIVSNWWGSIDCYKITGAQCSGFPLFLPPGDWLSSQPAIGDVDGNGKLDLIANGGLWEGAVYAWELTSSRTTFDKVYGRDWRMFQHDPQNSASSKASQFTVVCGDTNSDGAANGVDVTFLTNYLRNNGPVPVPLWAADVNGDSLVNQFDTQFYVNYLKGGSALRCPPRTDTLPPTIEITAPANGAAIHGTVTVSAYAWDNVGVAGVQFTVDGVNIGTEDTSAPFGFDWDTTQLAIGQHVLTATARDAAGNNSIASVNITIDNTAPTVEITNPLPDSWIIQSQNITANASDENGIVNVRFFIDNVLMNTDASSPYGFFLTYHHLTNGPHALTVIAQDTAGNESSVTSNFTIDSWNPTVNISNPVNNQIIYAPLTITADAADNFGVASVGFRLDSTDLGPADTEAPYSIELNSDNFPSGQHHLRATATDLSGRANFQEIHIMIAAEAPVVNITNPLPNSYVHGIISFNAEATDQHGVTGVQFQIDGVNIGQEDTTVPYSIDWDSTQTSNGPRTLTAVATDTVGHTAFAARSLTIDNTPPTLTFGISDGATVTGNVNLYVDVNDIGSSVAGVQYAIDGINVGPEYVRSPYVYTWQTGDYAEGNHTISATARDQAGNSTSSSITLNVVNHRTIDITFPFEYMTISDYTFLSSNVTPSDYYLELYYDVDGQSVAPAWYWDNVQGFTGWWDSRTVANGQHTLSAHVPGEENNIVNQINFNTNNGDWLAAFENPMNGTILWKDWTPTWFYLRGTNPDYSWPQNLPYDKVQYVAIVDGQPVNIGAELYYPPYEMPWDYSMLPEGWYTVRAMVDPAGEPANDYVVGAELMVRIKNGNAW